MYKEKYTFDDLLEIMARLRGENGCPWDREQTHESLRIYMIEETYEVLEADSGTGDSAMNSAICCADRVPCADREENGMISTSGCDHGGLQKLISRHPHIFGNVKADTAEKVVEN